MPDPGATRTARTGTARWAAGMRTVGERRETRKTETTASCCDGPMKRPRVHQGSVPAGLACVLPVKATAGRTPPMRPPAAAQRTASPSAAQHVPTAPDDPAAPGDQAAPGEPTARGLIGSGCRMAPPYHRRRASTGYHCGRNGHFVPRVRRMLVRRRTRETASAGPPPPGRAVQERTAPVRTARAGQVKAGRVRAGRVRERNGQARPRARWVLVRLAQAT